MPNSTLTDQTLQGAEGALEATQRTANQALDSMGHALDQGVERVRAAGQQVRQRAARASDATVTYIRHEPVKSVLIAAAAGAAVVALISLLNRPHGR